MIAQAVWRVGSVWWLCGAQCRAGLSLPDSSPYRFDARTERRLRIRVPEFIRRQQRNYSLLFFAFRVREGRTSDARDKGLVRLVNRVRAEVSEASLHDGFVFV